MNRELERWLENVDKERRIKARERTDMRTMFAQDIRSRIDQLERERGKVFSERGQSEFEPLRRDPAAFRIEGLRDALHMIVGVRK